MGKRILNFTIFTFLLFAVSTVTIALDPINLPRSDVVYKSSTVADSDAEKPESEVDKTSANERLPETQTFDVRTIDSTPREIFSRSVPIQRHSFDKTIRIPLRFVRRHPCRKFKKSFMIPTKTSYGNDMMLSDKSITVDLETIGDPIPMKWLEIKHEYGHRHSHHHDKDEKFEIKYEKLNDVSDHHKEKKREHKGGYMRRIRKFLKHTFD